MILLQRAVQVSIEFKPSKCVFFTGEIELLGHNINQDGRKPKSKGITAITEMKSPTNVTKSSSFLVIVRISFIMYYKPNMFDHTFLVCQLLNKGFPFKWTKDNEHSFQNSKHLTRD